MGLVVFCTKARNRFCPMCTKECHTVMNRPNSFWGQFWGQNGKADSHTHRSNKRAVLVLLRNADTNITGFSQVKSPTNQYISFVLQQEVVRKPTLHHPRTPPLSPRETPLFGRVRTTSARCLSSQIPPQIPRLWGFLTQERLFLCRLCPDGFHLYRKSLH